MYREKNDEQTDEKKLFWINYKRLSLYRILTIFFGLLIKNYIINDVLRVYVYLISTIISVWFN